MAFGRDVPVAEIEAIVVSVPTGAIGVESDAQAEIHSWGDDVMLIAYGSLFPTCVKAADVLRKEGLSVGVINARFAKPLDRATLLRAVEELPLVVTVEEGTLEGGFGSALLEAANAARLDTRHVVRLGIPDRFVEHGERGELLADLGLDANGIADAVRRALGRDVPVEHGLASGGR